MRDLRNEKFERQRKAAEEKQLEKLRNHPQVPEDFDWREYVLCNPSLMTKNINNEINVLRHWLKQGKRSGLKYKKEDHAQEEINEAVFPQEVVKIEKPVLHKEPGVKISVDEIAPTIKESKKSLNKRVIYTCISGPYDTVKKISNQDDTWDYVCFTNAENVDLSTGWEFRRIPTVLEPLDQTRRARAVKILPHLFLPEYDSWIWIDGTIEVLESPTKFVNKLIKKEDVFVTCKHPDRICVYQEKDACVKYGKDSTTILSNQANQYMLDGYPRNWGMIQSNLIYRKNTQDVIDLCNLWWEQVLKFSKRDQMSFNYVLWKKPIPVRTIRPSIVCSEYFWLWTHNSRDAQRAKLRKTYDDIQNFINGKPS